MNSFYSSYWFMDPYFHNYAVQFQTSQYGHYTGKHSEVRKARARARLKKRK